MKFYNVSFFIILICPALFSCAENSNITAQASIAAPLPLQDFLPKLAADSNKKDTISIVAVGDIMIGSHHPSKKNLPPDDARNSFKQVEKYLKGDIIFGNLEGSLLGEGKSTKCKDSNSIGCYAFKMPERYGGIIQKAGFNLLSTANNHVGDFGAAGRKRTAAILDSLEIHHAGLVSQPYTIFQKDSITYAFCAFSPNDFTLQITAVDSAKALVSLLKQHADIVIISFHGGAEGAKYEHVTRQTEIFYEEDRGNVYDFAHAVIDAGADVVLGHGPHVTRAVEVYKSKFIAYSLGNFCTYGQFSLAGPNGIAPLLNIRINNKGDFLYAEVTSVKQDKINRLTTDPEYRAFKKIANLTNSDFPGHQLQFTSNRYIRLKTE
jgi:poly-gamma-glutamate capsule biosynthesis protein CapA/YwtB (metallophosphatase superfamily)